MIMYRKSEYVEKKTVKYSIFGFTFITKNPFVDVSSSVFCKIFGNCYSFFVLLCDTEDVEIIPHSLCICFDKQILEFFVNIIDVEF